MRRRSSDDPLPPLLLRTFLTPIYERELLVDNPLLLYIDNLPPRAAPALRAALAPRAPRAARAAARAVAARIAAARAVIPAAAPAVEDSPPLVVSSSLSSLLLLLSSSESSKEEITNRSLAVAFHFFISLLSSIIKGSSDPPDYLPIQLLLALSSLYIDVRLIGEVLFLFSLPLPLLALALSPAPVLALDSLVDLEAALAVEDLAAASLPAAPYNSGTRRYTSGYSASTKPGTAYGFYVWTITPAHRLLLACSICSALAGAVFYDPIRSSRALFTC